MSRLLCCLRARRPDMGAALSHPQEGEAVDGAGVPAAPPTMADVIRERKKKAGGAGLGTLRRRIVAAARRPRDQRPDRGCEHGRFVRSVVSSWRLGDVFLVCGELEAASALRDLVTQAELAREPAAALHMDLHRILNDRWRCDVELVGSGWTLAAHRAIIAARCTYFRELLQRYPPSWGRVPLEGAAAGLARDELEACLRVLYGGPAHRPACGMCTKWGEGGGPPDGGLDIISSDHSAGSMGRGGRCSSHVRRLATLLGFQPHALLHDLRYLLDSGEMCDARLVFRLEGGGAAYGFRSALDLPCHRVMLAARSRFFRNVLCRRSSGGAVCVDEKVLPRRFARALLHAVYTDQVDLSLIGRNSTSPSSTSTGSGGSAWPGVARSNNSRPTTTAMLDDAFQLYEIARFLEMPIVMQGCEDAIVFALSPDSLAHVLRWAAAPHASHWVHRQAMRYLRDEFPAIMSHAGAAKLTRATLATTLASPFLQASEAQLVRALLRWWERAQPPEPNLVWHTGAAGRRGRARAGRGGGGGDGGDGALRDLLPLVRLEHLPPDHDVLNQLVRRGLVESASSAGGGPAGGGSAGGGSADAWLGRGAHRPARCFLPYLDEIKALLEGQSVPEAELARARRALAMQRIPDTLYMVAAGRGAEVSVGPDGGACGACVSPRLRGALLARVRELTAAPPATAALAAHAADPTTVYRQIALRAVREMSLPDTCAELLLADIESDRERAEEWSSPADEPRDLDGPDWTPEPAPDCCRTLSGTGSLHCASSGSLRSVPTLHIPLDGSRSGTCRRDANCAADAGANGAPSCGSVGRGGGSRLGRLSAAVPDVAMAPNGNTHLLTARDYCPHPPHPPSEYSAVGVLQLDLGDGATHTPRPGSRAQRAGAPRAPRDHSQAMSCLRARPEDDELRAAIELSVIRAYSSMAARAAGVARNPSAPLYRPDLPSAPRSPAGPARRPTLSTPPPILTLGRPPAAGSSRSPSPSRARPRHDYTLYTHRDYRADSSFGSGSGASRGHSPNHYA